MKSVTDALKAHLESNVATVATCWKVTRTDGEVLGFTDHVRDIIVDGVRMKAATGYTRSAIAGNSALSVDNVDLEGLIASTGITVEDCRNGLFDYAEVEVFLVNYNDLSMGKVILRRGFLGELTLKDGVFLTEIRGVVQALSRDFIDIVTNDCRVEFCSKDCGLDKTLFTEEGEVTAIITQRRIIATDLPSAGLTYSGGELTFTSGLNDGRSMEVKSMFQSGEYGDTEQISSWARWNKTYYSPVIGGPVTVTTGALGIIEVEATLSFTFTDGSGLRNIYGKWQIRVLGDVNWVDMAPEVISSSGGSEDVQGVIAVPVLATGLTPNTDYELRFMARRATSGDNKFILSGTATITADAPIEEGTDTNNLTFFLPFNHDIAVGDTFTIVRGCDKTETACKGFDNFVNFRGFPDVPGNDWLMRTPEYKPPEVD